MMFKFTKTGDYRRNKINEIIQRMNRTKYLDRMINNGKCRGKQSNYFDIELSWPDDGVVCSGGDDVYGVTIDADGYYALFAHRFGKEDCIDNVKIFNK